MYSPSRSSKPKYLFGIKWIQNKVTSEKKRKISRCVFEKVKRQDTAGE